MYRKIGIVYDDSENSLFALKRGVEFSKRMGSSPTIMGIMDIVTPMKPFLAHHDDDLDEKTPVFRKKFSHIRSRVKKMLSDAEAYAKGEGVKVSIMFLEGQPSEQLFEQSKKFDLLFVGAHSKMKGRSENIYGKLAKDARCDVFVARKERMDEILLALKGTILDREVIEKGILFAKSADAHVTALHVSGTMDERKDKASIVRRAKEAGAGASVKVRGLLARGSVTSKILSHAAKSDLVIVGSKGVGGLGDMLFGTFSEKITMKAQSSVLMVKAVKRRK